MLGQGSALREREVVDTRSGRAVTEPLGTVDDRRHARLGVNQERPTA
jgi:hypothetical protein